MMVEDEEVDLGGTFPSKEEVKESTTLDGPAIKGAVNLERKGVSEDEKPKYSEFAEIEESKNQLKEETLVFQRLDELTTGNFQGQEQDTEPIDPLTHHVGIGINQPVKTSFSGLKTGKNGFKKSLYLKGGLDLDLQGRNGFTENEILSFNKAEISYYEVLFTVVDSDEDGMIGGTEGAAFFRRACIDDSVLREVWRQACGGVSKPCLEIQEWFIALKLISFAQKNPGAQISLNSIAAQAGPQLGQDSITYLPLPNFGIQPWNKVNPILGSGTEVFMFPRESCTISIDKAEPVGTGMSKFIMYTLNVSTSLAHSQRPLCTIQRRYSDFRWLNKYLRKRFPSTVLPPLPSKKYIGNFDANFIEARRLDLQYYINNVARHSKLSSTLEVQVMLDATRKGLQDFKNLVEKDLVAFTFINRALNEKEIHGYSGNEMEGINRNDSIDSDPQAEGDFGKTEAKRLGTSFQENDTKYGVRWLQKVFRKVAKSVSPYDPFPASATSLKSIEATRDWIVSFKRSIFAHERNLHTTLAAIESTVSARRERAYRLSRIACYVEKISEVEYSYRNTAAVGNGDVNNAFEFFAGVGKHLDSLSNLQQDINDKISEEIIGALRYEIGIIRSVNYVLENHDKMIKNVMEAHGELEHQRKAYAVARADVRVTAVAAQAEKERIERAEEKVQHLETNLLEFHNCVIEEMKRYNEEKQCKLQLLIQRLAQILGDEDTNSQLSSIQNLSKMLH